MGRKCYGNQRTTGYIKTIKLNNSRGWNSDLPNPTERTKMAEKIRLNKFISDSGVCSRREADKFIETGKVLVNGHRAVVGELVSAKDKVMLNGQRIEAKVGD